MSSVNAQHDVDLVRDCLSGNQRAFEALVRKYEKPLYNVAFRMLRDRDDAMDVVQTVFVKAYEKLGSFDPKREFFSWIYRIAINESINASNRTKRMDEYESGVTAALPPSQEARRHEEILSEEIERAIAVLKLDYRMVIVLKHFHDFSYQEMAEVLGIEEKTVKSRLFSARQQLKDILSSRGVER
ncbi:MAG TPA: sigma-70 family RNA polymerase sigma factor [Candidatus Krumholzibacteria bacterium]|nr:sigma-70 family RNA polymerase sigma factor [Candidatus Krumholzibacteria bacterium]